MKKKWRMLLALVLAVLLCMPVMTVRSEAAARNVHVLMIGNSLTRSADGRNSTVTHLKKLAEKQGITLDVEVVARGGAKLEDFSNPRKLKSLADRVIKKGKWDYIILQEYQDLCVYSYSTYLNGTRKLCSTIRKYSPRAKICLNAVWPETRNMRHGGQIYNPRQQKNHIFWNTDKVAAADGIPRRQIIYSGKGFWGYQHLSDRGTRKRLYSDYEHGSDIGYYLNALCIAQRILPKQVSSLCWYGKAGKYEAELMMKVVEQFNPK